MSDLTITETTRSNATDTIDPLRWSVVADACTKIGLGCFFLAQGFLLMSNTSQNDSFTTKGQVLVAGGVICGIFQAYIHIQGIRARELAKGQVQT